MTDSAPTITFQTAFGDDGDVELAETSVETSLEDFDATVRLARVSDDSLNQWPVESAS